MKTEKEKAVQWNLLLPEDGVFTIYLTALQDKTFYVTKPVLRIIQKSRLTRLM